jgi:hypothetical protein
MMIRLLPKWFGEEEENLKRAVWEIANKNNINFKVVTDSKTINDCIDAIMLRLVTISELAKPEQQLKDFKILEEAERKDSDETAKKLKKGK